MITVLTSAYRHHIADTEFGIFQVCGAGCTGSLANSTLPGSAEIVA
ncbi:MAG: hypothetical protein GY928_23830 [Colwellia sp.]|nr:hypothetical protein [Colwellia sp.]